jgi:hypothetical protein
VTHPEITAPTPERQTVSPDGRTALPPPPPTSVGERLLRRWYLLIFAVLIGAAVTVVSLYNVNGSGLHKKGTSTIVASTQLLIDSRTSSLIAANRATTASSLTQRAPLLAEEANLTSVHDQVARLADVPTKSVQVQGISNRARIPYSNQPASVDALHSHSTVFVVGAGKSPTIQISATSGSPERASKLVTATVTALRQTITRLGSKQHIPLANRIVLRGLGPVTVGHVDTSPKKTKPIAYGIGAFVIVALLVLFLDSTLETRRRRRGAAIEAPSG